MSPIGRNPLRQESPEDCPELSPRFAHDFFQREGTEALSRTLLGTRLVTVVRGVRTSGEIVEVEAYLGSNDPACHAARGITKRNSAMFSTPGHCYVYLIYGLYYCVNVVTDPEGVGSAILIRAVVPTEGLHAMKRRRGSSDPHQLARGPGRLCQSFGISSGFSGEHFATSSRIWIEPYRQYSPDLVGVSPRIGISVGQDLPLRFFVKGSPWLSR